MSDYTTRKDRNIRAYRAPRFGITKSDLVYNYYVKTMAEKLIRNNAINGTDNMKCKFYEDYFIT